jgi:hypothetical protein
MTAQHKPTHTCCVPSLIAFVATPASKCFGILFGPPTYDRLDFHAVNYRENAEDEIMAAIASIPFLEKLE